MRMCLAFAFQNDAHWLRLHLPVWVSAGVVDGIVALDGGSIDGGADVVREYGVTVYERPFDWNFGAHMNALIEACEAAGFDAVLRLDPDELMWPHDINLLSSLLGEYHALRLARYNFEGDRLHVFPYMYPDYQTRAWRLNQGVRYEGRVHETLEASMKRLGWREDGGAGIGPREIVSLPHVHLYHYEGLRQDAHRALKHVNYHRLMNGQPPVDALPEGYNTNGAPRFAVAFVGPQPLDPVSVGVYAPFEEARA